MFHHFRPRGVEEAVEIYAHLADEDMVLAFEEALSESQTAPQGMTAKIRLLILVRLEQALPHKEVVRKTLQYLRKPSRAKLSYLALGILYSMNLLALLFQNCPMANAFRPTKLQMEMFHSH